MSTYNVARSAVEVSGHKADLFKVGFGTSAQNDEIVRDAEKVLAGIFDESDDELSTTCKGERSGFSAGRGSHRALAPAPLRCRRSVRSENVGVRRGRKPQSRHPPRHGHPRLTISTSFLYLTIAQA